MRRRTTAIDGRETALRFRLLGSIEATANGRRIELGGPKPRLVWALLLLDPGKVVPTGRLVDALWGDDGPADPKAALQVKVSNLRRAVQEVGVVIDFRDGGYVAEVEANSVDVHRFDELVVTGTGLVAVDPQQAATVLRDALALWRGRPFGDLVDEPVLGGEVARLEQTRLRALEQRIAADLATGSHGRVVEELQHLTRTHPLREGLWAHLVVALYRSERQADALAAYEHAAAHLREALGIDPSPRLRELQARILRQDPSLELTAPRGRTGGTGSKGRSIRGYELLEEVGSGRMGTIHRARQPGSEELVAVEVLDESETDDPDLIHRFAEATERVARIDHPNLASLVDAWRRPGEACLVSQWVDGETLDSLIRDGPLGPLEVSGVVSDVARVLDHAHQHGIQIHSLSARDLIRREEGGTVVAGLAAAVLADNPVADDGRVDVSPLGLVAFELLTGQRVRMRHAAGARVATTPVPGLPPLGEVRPDLPVAIGAVLAEAVATEPHQPFGSAADFAAALRSAVGTREAGDAATAHVRNPFKGLQAFREADAGDYRGRQEMIQRLADRLERSSAAIVGPSGSGKSSLVRAGLIPHVRGRSWFVASMQPGEWPMAELERALTEIASCDAADVARALRTGDGGLHGAVDTALPDHEARLLLFIDQFEEVFTLARREDRDAFVRRLAHCLASDRQDVRVVLTIRADFYDKLLLEPDLGAWVADHTVATSPLTAEEIEAAITEPAARVGVSVEPEVTAVIASEVVGAPGSLPLLQFTLTELFDARAGGRLTLNGYDAIGGLSGALVGRAERLYAELGDTGRATCRQAFLRLVTVSDSPTETRRRVLRAELLAAGDPEVVAAVLEAFGGHRLLTFDRDPFTRMSTVEIAHEALTREWGRLRGWIDSARADITMHRRVRAAVDEWRLNGRDPSYLLRGSRLEEVAAWTGSSSIVLTEAEREYVDESLNARHEQEAAERERVARERELERRAGHRLRIIAAVSVVAAMVATALTMLAFQQRQQARDQQRIAEQQSRVATARELAAAAVTELDTDPERSILLATEAVRTTRDVDGTVLPEAETALHRAIVSQRLVDQIAGVGGHLALAPDGGLLVTEGPEDSGLIDIRDTATGESVHAFRGHDGSVGDRPPDLNAVAFGPQGQLLATAGDDGTLRIWDQVWETTDDTELHVVTGSEPGTVWGPSFSSDGRLVAAAWREEGTVRVFDLVLGEVVLEVDGLVRPWTAAFDPAGDRLAVLSLGGPPGIVLDVDTGERLFELPEAGGRAVAWSPDGRHLATSSLSDSSAQIWDAEDGSLRSMLFGHAAEVSSIAWSPDPARLATGSIDGTARVWGLEPAGARQELVLGTAPKGLQGLAFTPDGERLIAGEEGPGETTNVRIWDLTERGTAEVSNFPGASRGPTSTDYGMDRDRVWATSTAGTIVLWDLGTGEAVLEIDPTSDGPPITTDLARSPSGDHLAVVTGSGVQVRDATTGDLVADVTFDGSVSAVAWHPSGRRLAAVDRRTAVTILNLDDGSASRLEPSTSDRPAGWVAVSVAFSPDGTRLAVGGGHDNRPDSWHVELWDWNDASLVRTLETGQFVGPHLAFNPDGSMLAAAGFGPTEVFDVRTGQRIDRLAQRGGGVTALAFSPDGSRLATAGVDGTIRLWDPGAAREVLALSGHPSRPVVSLAFSPDGTRLVSGDAVGPPPGAPTAEPGDEVGQVRVWALDIDELLDIADQEVNRELTPAECRQYLATDCRP